MPWSTWEQGTLCRTAGGSRGVQLKGRRKVWGRAEGGVASTAGPQSSSRCQEGDQREHRHGTGGCENSPEFMPVLSPGVRWRDRSPQMLSLRVTEPGGAAASRKPILISL